MLSIFLALICDVAKVPIAFCPQRVSDALLLQLCWYVLLAFSFLSHPGLAERVAVTCYECEYGCIDLLHTHTDRQTDRRTHALARARARTHTHTHTDRQSIMIFITPTPPTPTPTPYPPQGSFLSSDGTYTPLPHSLTPPPHPHSSDQAPPPPPPPPPLTTLHCQSTTNDIIRYGLLQPSDGTCTPSLLLHAPPPPHILEVRHHQPPPPLTTLHCQSTTNDSLSNRAVSAKRWHLYPLTPPDHSAHQAPPPPPPPPPPPLTTLHYLFTTNDSLSNRAVQLSDGTCTL